MNKENTTLIESHLAQFFTTEDEVFFFDDIQDKDFPVDIFWIRNSGKRDFQILLTAGVSQKAMDVPNESGICPYIELALLLPSDWKTEEDDLKNPVWGWPIPLLKIIGRFPHDNNCLLTFGHSLALSVEHPLPGTKFTAVLLLKSIHLPESFQHISAQDKEIEIYLVFPLYQSEFEYLEKNPVFSLLELFDKKGITDIVNVNREAAV